MLNKFLLFIILILGSTNLAAAVFDHTEFCQSDEFGRKKNLELKLNHFNIRLIPTVEFWPENFLVYFIELLNSINYDKTAQTLILDSPELDKKEVSKKNIIKIAPILFESLNNDAFDFNKDNFCQKKQVLNAHLPYVNISLTEFIINQILTKEMMRDFFKNKYGIDPFEIRVESDRYRLINNSEISRIIAGSVFLGTSFINGIKISKIFVLNSGYHLEEGKKANYFSSTKELLFTEDFFQKEFNQSVWADFLDTLAKLKWESLNENKKKQYFDLNWGLKEKVNFPLKGAVFYDSISQKSVLDDFVVHFSLFLNNGLYLKQFSLSRYNYFLNNYFNENIFLSNYESLKSIKEELVQNQEDIKSNIEIDKNLIKYEFIISSEKIKKINVFKDIYLKSKSFSIKLDPVSLKVSNSLKLKGILYLKNYPSLNESFTHLEIIESKKPISFELSPEIKLISPFKKIEDFFSMTTEGAAIKLRINKSFENLKLFWEGENHYKTAHVLNKLFKEGEFFNISFNPNQPSMNLKLKIVQIENEKIVTPNFSFNFKNKQLLHSKFLEKIEVNDNLFQYKFYSPSNKTLKFEFISIKNNRPYIFDSSKNKIEQKDFNIVIDKQAELIILSMQSKGEVSLKDLNLIKVTEIYDAFTPIENHYYDSALGYNIQLTQ